MDINGVGNSFQFTETDEPSDVDLFLAQRDLDRADKKFEDADAAKEAARPNQKKMKMDPGGAALQRITSGDAGKSDQKEGERLEQNALARLQRTESGQNLV